MVSEIPTINHSVSVDHLVLASALGIKTPVSDRIFQELTGHLLGDGEGSNLPLEDAGFGPPRPAELILHDTVFECHQGGYLGAERALWDAAVFWMLIWMCAVSYLSSCSDLRIFCKYVIPQ